MIMKLHNCGTRLHNPLISAGKRKIKTLKRWTVIFSFFLLDQIAVFN